MRKPRHIETLEYGPGKALKTVDPVLTRMFQKVQTIYAPADFPVVVQGETGTGKEGVARAIHWHSPRRDKPFVAVNCGAIPEGLVDSEFFGHERGAFTGAITTRKGHLELANGGTLFLDEIGEMPLALQARLLRALQEQEIVRVGSSKPISVDIRVVAATNKDLKKLVDEEKFRADLYYRIASCILQIPPLRERSDDVVMLSRHFIAQSKKKSRVRLRLQPMAAKALSCCRWPGNIRELRGCIEVAVARALASDRASVSVDDFLIDFGNVISPSRKEAVASIEPELINYRAQNPNATLMEIAVTFGLDYHFVRRLIRKHEKGSALK